MNWFDEKVLRKGQVIKPERESPPRPGRGQKKVAKTTEPIQGGTTPRDEFPVKADIEVYEKSAGRWGFKVTVEGPESIMFEEYTHGRLGYSGPILSEKAAIEIADEKAASMAEDLRVRYAPKRIKYTKEV